MFCFTVLIFIVDLLWCIVKTVEWIGALTQKYIQTYFLQIFLIFGEIRVINVLTSLQCCNTLTAHFAYPSVGDCYYRFDLHLVSKITFEVFRTYFHGPHVEETRKST